jgi:CBS domain-containing protein
MKERRVHRLPALDRQERLVAIVSMNDLVARADSHPGANVPGDKFLATLKSICGHSVAAVPA